jgi:hypothetical protein
MKKNKNIYLETLIDLIASIKLLVLKRYQNGQLASPSSSPNQSLEAVFDQLVTNKYSKYFSFNLISSFIILRSSSRGKY